MFFADVCKTINKYIKKSSLHAQKVIHHPNSQSTPIQIQLLKQHTEERRTSSFISPVVKASMCVEAAFSCSFFLFFLANVFSMIFLFVQYAEAMETLQQRGKRLSAYAYAVGQETGEDVIHLVDTKTAEALFPVFPFTKSTLLAQCCVKAWTGYSPASAGRQKEEALVYVAEYGEVYHRSRQCTHLSLSVEMVAYEVVNTLRNQDGSRYRCCEVCAEGGFLTVAFVTGYGTRYHAALNCSGLKRTVRAVPLSQAGSLRPCGKCG